VSSQFCQQCSADGPPYSAVRPVASSSWLGRIFRREGGSPQQGSGPIKAKLGEETSFVYDPVEKRWVNKKVSPAVTRDNIRE
jgi:hypothetical protein